MESMEIVNGVRVSDASTSDAKGAFTTKGATDDPTRRAPQEEGCKAQQEEGGLITVMPRGFDTSPLIELFGWRGSGGVGEGVRTGEGGGHVGKAWAGGGMDCVMRSMASMIRSQQYDQQYDQHQRAVTRQLQQVQQRKE
jgi:hypothetical protein